MKTIYRILTVMIFMLIGINMFSQTAGTFTFKISSVDQGGGTYSPKYIMGVWVTTNTGTFVKTLLLTSAKGNENDLLTWKANSSSNKVNAVTSATPNTAQNFTIIWDAKNAAGTIVSDGTYKIWIEQIDTHAEGPVTSFTFGKTTTAISNTTVANYTPFNTMSYNWAPLVPVTGVTINPATLNLLKNNSSSLSAIISPAGATNKTVTWLSLNTGIATVDAAGSVTGVAVGNTKIIVTTADGSFKDTCDVTITLTAVAVTGIKLNHDTLKISTGNNSTLIPTISPANATNLSVVWITMNSSVASVSSGLITAVAPGTVKIIVTTIDGGFSDTCEVIVTTSSIVLENGSEEQLSVFPNPASTAIAVSFNAIEANAKIDIFKPDGTKVVSKEFTLTEGKNTIQIQLENLADGFYFISLRNGSKTLTKPFLIER
jgi:uncharacterized protein YjdB